MTRRAEGLAELDVYFEKSIPVEEKIIFSLYVHEHLLQNAADVVRLRYYECPHCGTPVGNREVAMKRLQAWRDKVDPNDLFASRKLDAPTIVCSECENRVPLWDDMERQFSSSAMKNKVRKLEQQSEFVLDSERDYRSLVGEIVSTVTLAGQTCREKPISNNGTDLEIEFNDDEGRPTGQVVYVQTKLSDHYTRASTRNTTPDQELDTRTDSLRIKNEQHAARWLSSSSPVILLVRSSEFEIEWMDVREYLKRYHYGGRRPPRELVFKGQRFDAMTVRQWRDSAFNAALRQE